MVTVKWQMLQMRTLFFIISTPLAHIALKSWSGNIWGNDYSNILFDIIVLVRLQDQEILCPMAFRRPINNNNKKPTIRFLPVL